MNVEKNHFMILEDIIIKFSTHNLGAIFIPKIQKKRRNNIMSKETYNYKRQAITIAKQLFYPQSVILRLQSATTENEIARIMKTARERMED